MKKKDWQRIAIFVLVCCNILAYSLFFYRHHQASQASSTLKWVDFTVPAQAMTDALRQGITLYTEKSSDKDWISLLAYLAMEYGGDWSKYQRKDLDALVQKLETPGAFEEKTKDRKDFDYYETAYRAVLGGFVGEYQREYPDKKGRLLRKQSYGLQVFSPIAEGFSYTHYDDFGDSRSYGYRRRHLGNDLLGNIGTPIAAVEAGYVEEIGWNQYGGWRIGIRSFDQMRYYYYAHLRKDHPFQLGLEKGSLVQAGDIIGYLGMTGYSVKENVNNMSVPHLHFGMQIIFDESQKEGNGEIWIDVYEIVKFLSQNRVTVARDPETKEYNRVFRFFTPHFAGYSDSPMEPSSSGTSP